LKAKRQRKKTQHPENDRRVRPPRVSAGADGSDPEVMMEVELDVAEGGAGIWQAG